MFSETNHELPDTLQRVSAGKSGSQTAENDPSSPSQPQDSPVPGEAAATAAGQSIEPSAKTFRRRAGAPRGNGNRITNALKASKLPKSAKYIESRLADFRHVARGELESLHGKGNVGLYLESLLLSAARHEMRSQLCLRWLRLEGDSLPMEQRLSLLSAVSAASDARDRCLRSAGLDRLVIPADDDPWSDLYPRGGKRDPSPDEPEKPLSHSDDSKPVETNEPARTPQRAAEKPTIETAVVSSPADETPDLDDLLS